VTVGHVTVDVIAADASRRPGGGAFYSALQAARLGLRTLILTQGSAPEIEALLEPYSDELELCVIPAPATTTLLTSWPGGRRTQQVLAWAGPIAGTIAVDTQILHFAPVVREIPAAWRGRADFVGLTPQGLVRKWDQGGAASGTIVPAPLPGDRGSLEVLLPHGCSAVVISEQERVACTPLLDAAADIGAVIAITAGPGATSVQTPAGECTRVQAPAVAEPRDELGAGDVFAAAFFVALHEGLPPELAAAFAGAAAAIRIEGSGADAIGDRSAIEARLP
jgi:pfkB family carbohydrate kinase